MDVLTVMDLDFAIGSTNLGGTQGKVQYVPATHVKTWPEYEADGVTLKTVPVLYTDKRWAELYYTKDTGSISDKPVGELDGRSYETEIEFLIPKTTADLIKLITLFTNGPFIFVMTDGNGLRRVIGSPRLGAYCTASDTISGKSAKDRNGVSFKFMASGAKPAAICEFDISLAKAI